MGKSSGREMEDGRGEGKGCKESRMGIKGLEGRRKGSESGISGMKNVGGKREGKMRRREEGRER